MKSDILKTIHSRKSVRKYTEKKVNREDLDTLIKAGMAAPTAKNTQPWEFIVITKKETLIKLAEAMENGKMLAQAGAAIIICGNLERALEGDREGYWIHDCAAATENILLAAESLGLGAVWIGLHPVSEREGKVREISSIPQEIIPFSVISIGYPEGDEQPKNKYNSDFIHEEKW